MEDWSLPTSVSPTLSVHCTSDTWQEHRHTRVVGNSYSSTLGMLKATIIIAFEITLV